MLVLWDVDGTLVRAGQAGRLAFADAVGAVLGEEVPHTLLPRMSGKTDPQIALEILAELGLAEDPALLARIERALEAALTDRVPQIQAEGRVLPGVADLIEALTARGAVQTLVTGNIEPNARTKLDALGLLEGHDIRLELGAYGSDNRDRDLLVPIALGRCAAAGVAVDPERTWVIGDTPRDLACARAGRVRCLLVATGTYDEEAIAAAGADAWLPDLHDTTAVLGILGGELEAALG